MEKYPIGSYFSSYEQYYERAIEQEKKNAAET